jgi:signal peptidase I
MEPQNQPLETTTPIRNKKILKDLISYTLTALVIVLPVRMWVAQPFVVNGGSMDTTFANGEYLIVDELSYRFEEPARGDVIVFKYPIDPKKYFIKRIIGLPGETVSVKDQVVKITNTENPKGMVLKENYIHSQTFGNVKTTLKDDEYFVMGDNRLVSSDSRFWGNLPKKNITGRPIVRLLPFTRINYLPGAIEVDKEK